MEVTVTCVKVQPWGLLGNTVALLFCINAGEQKMGKRNRKWVN